MTEAKLSEEAKAWRNAQRARLVALRLSYSDAARSDWTQRIMQRLEPVAMAHDGPISVYWPFRGEPDLRGLGAELVARGARLALPVVLERGRPLVFRAWAPGDPLEPGIWNIPVPARDERVVPELIVAPVVGFDRGAYRLGYGGGYFDRTLAALAPGWRAFGVGPAMAELATIHPLPHDVALDAIVTPDEVVPRPGARR